MPASPTPTLIILPPKAQPKPKTAASVKMENRQRHFEDQRKRQEEWQAAGDAVPSALKRKRKQEQQKKDDELAALVREDRKKSARKPFASIKERGDLRQHGVPPVWKLGQSPVLDEVAGKYVDAGQSISGPSRPVQPQVEQQTIGDVQLSTFQHHNPGRPLQRMEIPIFLRGDLDIPPKTQSRPAAGMRPQEHQRTSDSAASRHSAHAPHGLSVLRTPVVVKDDSSEYGPVSTGRSEPFPATPRKVAHCLKDLNKFNDKIQADWPTVRRKEEEIHGPRTRQPPKPFYGPDVAQPARRRAKVVKTEGVTIPIPLQLRIALFDAVSKDGGDEYTLRLTYPADENTGHGPDYDFWDGIQKQLNDDLIFPSAERVEKAFDSLILPYKKKNRPPYPPGREGELLGKCLTIFQTRDMLRRAIVGKILKPWDLRDLVVWKTTYQFLEENWQKIQQAGQVKKEEDEESDEVSDEDSGGEKEEEPETKEEASEVLPSTEDRYEQEGMFVDDFRSSDNLEAYTSSQDDDSSSIAAVFSSSPARPVTPPSSDPPAPPMTVGSALPYESPTGHLAKRRKLRERSAKRENGPSRRQDPTARRPVAAARVDSSPPNGESLEELRVQVRELKVKMERLEKQERRNRGS